MPLLALTIHVSSWTKGTNALGIDESGSGTGNQNQNPSGPRERETVITQEVPVKMLHQTAVDGLHEPRCRDPDVNIILPSLAQLKSISERFTKLATETAAGGGAKPASAAAGLVSASGVGMGASSAKLELSANMHGSLRLAIATDALQISSVWTDLVNPALDPSQLSQTEIEQLPSERMRAMADDDEAGWAKVRIDGKDWGRVLSVGRLSPKVVACECFLSLPIYVLWDLR